MQLLTIIAPLIFFSSLLGSAPTSDWCLDNPTKRAVFEKHLKFLVTTNPGMTYENGILTVNLTASTPGAQTMIGVGISFLLLGTLATYSLARNGGYFRPIVLASTSWLEVLIVSIETMKHLNAAGTDELGHCLGRKYLTIDTTGLTYYEAKKLPQTIHWQAIQRAEVDTTSAEVVAALYDKQGALIKIKDNLFNPLWIYRIIDLIKLTTLLNKQQVSA